MTAVADSVPPLERAPENASNEIRIDSARFQSDRLPARVESSDFIDVKTAPYVATPGEANWREYLVSANLFPGGDATASAQARDNRHIEYGGQFNDSWSGYLTNGLMSRYNTNFTGRDIKTEDGRLVKREVDISYIENGKNVGKAMSEVRGPDGKPLQGVTRYEFNYNSAARAYDVEFRLANGEVLTGQASGFADLKNINWDKPADLNRKYQGRSLLTPPQIATPGTAEFQRDTGSGARHMPGGEIENVRMTTHPNDVEHLGYKGNFKDGYLGNFIWPTHFDGYDVKDKSGNLIQRNINMSYIDWSGKELGKAMPDIIGPNGKPLEGVTNYQLIFDRTSGNYNVKFKFADGKSITGKASWAGLERITWDESR